MTQVSLGASDFSRLSARMLNCLEQGLIDADIDADPAFVSEGVLEVEFADGGKMILNRHDPSQEIWLAARTGAHHFRWNGTQWLDTRSGEELSAAVSRLAGLMAGQPVMISCNASG